MRRREAVLAMFAAASVVLALLVVFAIELSNTQAKSKSDVEARVHERAVLAGSLIDSLFSSVQQSVAQYSHTYGAPVVSNRTIARNRGQNAYLALLDASDRVLASSPGFTAQARADLASSAALRLVRQDRPYGLGNVLPYANTGVINLAVAFPTPFGTRILLTGFIPSTLSAFLAGELRQIPGVLGAHNYVLDGLGHVLASTNPALPPGYVFHTAAQRQVLSTASGNIHGHYYDKVTLTNSTWRILLAAPDGPLFASVTGLRKWVPWLIFVAFALVALAALGLGRRSLRTADQVREANAQLARVNTELEQSNAELARQARELARSNADLEQFASIASHDLQEPLRKVRTFTEQLAVIESGQLSEKGRDYIARANGAAERMQTLIEDLLKFSRVATHGRAFAPVDLEQLVTEVLEDLHVQVRRAEAVVHVGDLPTINADPPQMRQLMQNLLSNALKFRREGVPAEIDISATVENDKVAIVVRDNGIGFEPHYSRRIFRVFERLHGRNAYPGTGIGLALCRKIAERHGGTVVAAGVPNVGATFTVTIGMHHQQAVFAGDADTNAEPSRSPVETYVSV